MDSALKKKIAGFTLIEVLKCMAIISIASLGALSAISSVGRNYNETTINNYLVAISISAKSRLDQYLINQRVAGITVLPISATGNCQTSDELQIFLCDLESQINSFAKSSNNYSVSIIFNHLTNSSDTGKYCFLNSKFTVIEKSSNKILLTRNFLTQCNVQI